MEMDKKEVKSTSLSSYDIHQFISTYSTLSTTNRILYYYMHIREMTHFYAIYCIQGYIELHIQFIVR